MRHFTALQSQVADAPGHPQVNLDFIGLTSFTAEKSAVVEDKRTLPFLNGGDSYWFLQRS